MEGLGRVMIGRVIEWGHWVGWLGGLVLSRLEMSEL